MPRVKNFDEEAVLERAVDIFRRQGYAATTPAELVDHLGISRSSLYGTYGDKRSLFIKALQRYRETTTRNLTAIADNATDALQAIQDIFNLTLTGCMEDAMPKGCFLVNSIVELPQDEKEIIGIVTDSMQDNKNAFIKLIKKGQENGQLATWMKPDALADYLVNCLSGISITAKSGISQTACEAIIQNSMAIFKN